MERSESHKNLFRLKVAPTLIAQLAVHKVDADALIELATTQIHQMLSSKPNCRIFGDKKIWVVRGYFPDTPVFFKLTLVGVDKDRYGDASFLYFARLKPLQVNSKKGWMTSYGEFVVLSDNIHKHMSKSMENAVLDADHKLEPLLSTVIGKPKCMAPKGMKLLQYKPRKRKSAKA